MRARIRRGLLRRVDVSVRPYADRDEDLTRARSENKTCCHSDPAVAGEESSYFKTQSHSLNLNGFETFGID